LGYLNTSIAIILVYFVVVVSIGLSAQPFFEEKKTKGAFSEIEAIFSGDQSGTTANREVYQLAGGEVRPIQSNPTVIPIDNIPYQGYFSDFAQFGDFIGLFNSNLTFPMVNSTWRDAYLDTYFDSIRETAPTAKGRMTKSPNSRLLKPVLLDESRF
jgi:hypothetical protein